MRRKTSGDPEDTINYNSVPYNVYYDIINAFGENGENIDRLKAEGELWSTWDKLHSDIFFSKGWFGPQRRPRENVINAKKSRPYCRRG